MAAPTLPVGLGGLMSPPPPMPRATPTLPAPAEDVDIIIGDLDEGVTTPDGQLVVEHPDGSIEITEAPKPERGPSRFDDNLVEEMSVTDLGSLAADLLIGIEDDIQGRREWVDTYTKGMDLLGLKVEERSNAKFRKRTSTVRHPVLLESIVKFQSGARAEMLPANGPAKVKNDGEQTEETNQIAQDFERDLNHYLTSVATEFYPDTDRMLFYLGYGGTTYKKVYRCPVRQRPVSEAVYLPDLIVSNEATDLQNATRVTHSIQMPRIKVQELMIAGFYRDVDLMPPSPESDPIKLKERSIEGRQPASGARPEDLPRTIYECYTYILPETLGIPEPGAPKGLPLPYRVSIDKDSMVALEIRRAWKPDDENFRKRRFFVKFGLVPGFGFLDLGYLHLLGNQTKALTALWRIMIDAGMFASFPGGVKLKGSRASTNEVAPGPGEWVDYDVPAAPGMDIRQLMMPMPYKDVSPVLLQFSEIIGQDAMRMAGAVELEVGEGRSNVPVGTMLAMVEQQTQTMAAVHKRLHTAQAEELELLREVFAANPQDLSRFAKNPARQWEVAQEFMDLDLVPASDPNIPAQIHRIMQATALSTLAQQNPTLYDQMKVQKRLLRTIGISDADDLLIAPQPQGAPQGPNPLQLLAQQQAGETQARLAETEVKKQEIAVKAQTEQREAAESIVEGQQHQRETEAEMADSAAERASREKIAQLQIEADREKLAADIAKDNQAHGLAVVKTAADVAQPQGLGTMVGLPGKKRGRAAGAPSGPSKGAK